jgi:SPP1 family predicted phage head-tail adaptor
LHLRIGAATCKGGAMRAGKLTQRIRIERPTVTGALDDRGQETVAWSSIRSHVPAKIDTASGGETIYGRKLTADTTHVVTIRYIEGLATTDRIVWGTRTLNIGAVTDSSNRGNVLELHCKESVA